MSVGIVIDSNGGLTKKQAEELGYYYICMPIIIDQEEYFDGDTLTYEEFLIRARNTKRAMSTSQAIAQHVISAWDKGLEKHEFLVHITLSSCLSKMYETCLLLSEYPKYAGKVFVIDTLDVIGTYLYTIHIAKCLADKGVDKDEIIKVLKERRGTSWGVLVPETIDHLRRGGRINAATAALANFLNFKPLIKLYQGGLHKLDKERGSKEKGFKKVIKKVCDYIISDFNPDIHIPVVLHTNEEALAKEVAEMLQPLMPNQKIYFCNISAVVVCHTGPGAFAIALLKKHPGIDFPKVFNNFEY